MGNKNFLGTHKRVVTQQFKIRKPSKGKFGEDEFYYTQLPVQILIGTASVKSDRNTEWPEYNTDRERIKANNKKYRNVPINKMFEDAYDIKIDLNEECIERINHTPESARVGNTLNVTVQSITKNGTILDCTNLKQTLSSSVNLYKYDLFKKYVPQGVIRAKVVKVDNNRVTADPISPLFDEWINPITNNPKTQYNTAEKKTTKVKNLKLTYDKMGKPRGFIGQAVIPTVSDFVGEEYTIDAFIPGSQIVLNIETDFHQWEGKEVDTFISSYNPQKSNPGQMSLICSAKDYLKFQGDLNLIELFKKWCDADSEWDKISHTPMTGVVTGVLSSAKKQGVFVEIPELKITGMVPMPTSKLVDYHPGDEVDVYLKGIEENLVYDDQMDQTIHELPYVMNGDVLEQCSLKPVLTFDMPE